MKAMTMVSRFWLACLVLCVSAGCTGQEGPEAAVQIPVSESESVTVQWADTWDAAFSRAQTEEKVVLVTFYADWCIWCKKFEDTTLADNSVASFLSNNTVPIRLDVDGAGQDLSDEYEVDGLPTVLVLRADGSELGRIPGYLPPEGFLQRVKALVG